MYINTLAGDSADLTITGLDLVARSRIITLYSASLNPLPHLHDKMSIGKWTSMTLWRAFIGYSYGVMVMK